MKSLKNYIIAKYKIEIIINLKFNNFKKNN